MQHNPDGAELYAQAAAMTSLPAAIKHLRVHTGCSLVNGKKLAERIADDRPGSNLALARMAWEARSRRIKWGSIALAIALVLIAFVIGR